MTRNLKAFGLVLVAAMALGAIVAQGASAVVEHSVRSGAQSTVLTGEDWSNHVFAPTSSLALGCTVATFEGTHVGTPLDLVTVHPKYASCSSPLGNATVDTNGCNYIFDTDTTQASGHSASSEHATVSLECESSHAIELTAPGCNIAYSAMHSTTPVNQSVHGIRWDQIASDGLLSKHALTLSATVQTLKHIATAGSLCGLAGHPAGTYTNGSYSGVSILTGYQDLGSVEEGSTTTGRFWTHGNQVDITISTPT